MQDRASHQKEVLAFLQAHFDCPSWEFSLPHGWGNESYFARSPEQACFVKLGVQAARYQALASLGLTPPVLAAGTLPDGVSILVQPRIAGSYPRRSDYQARLEQCAAAIHTIHHCPELQRLLPKAASDLYREAGSQALERLRQKWLLYRPQVPEAASFVDESLDYLARQAAQFEGSGLAASHNDICNGNWIVSADGRLYLIDLESMSLDDPALDLGATLWWYYPPELWPEFLAAAGYTDGWQLRTRMHIRMAMHCLDILLPRPGSFDPFDPAAFSESLVDFRAILADAPNPEIDIED